MGLRRRLPRKKLFGPGSPPTLFRGGPGCAQAPVTCLIPKRTWTLLVLGLLGMVCIAGIEALYACSYQHYFADRRQVLAGLDVEARGSLAAWCASLLLAAAAAACVMVYSLRRHRLDDYRGRYRVWLWAVAGFLLASADAVTGLHAGVSLLAEDLVGHRVQVEAHVWWVGTLGAVLSVAALRLVIEMRACLAAVAATLAAGACYATSASLQTGILRLDGGLLDAMAQSTCLLTAALCIAGAVLCYARYVYRDAQGELRRRTRASSQESTPRRKSTAAAHLQEKQSSRSIRVDSAHAPETLANRTVPAAAHAPVEFNASEAASEEAEPDDQDQQLSRAERRRLRKQCATKASPASIRRGPHE